MIVRSRVALQCRTLAWRAPQVWRRPLASAAQATQGVAETVTTDDEVLEVGAYGPEAVARLVKPSIEALHEHALALARYQTLQHQRATSHRYGGVPTPIYEPHRLLSHPPSPSEITLELLLASQSHLGHATSLWHPLNSRYIFGIRQGVHVISLEATAAHLRRACRLTESVAAKGGSILFVGTRQGQQQCVVAAANRGGGCHLFTRWVPGTLTNSARILNKSRLKVVDEFDREIEVDPVCLSEVSALRPDLVIMANPAENYILLHECALAQIPTIGIIDTNVNPTWVTYPIPANDDSLRCVQLILGVLSRAAETGQQTRRTGAFRGSVPYEPMDTSFLRLTETL